MHRTSTLAKNLALLGFSCHFAACDPGSQYDPPGTAGGGSGATTSCTEPGAEARLDVKVPSPIPTPTLGVEAIADLKRGINLGNALEAPEEAEWGVTLTEGHFRVAAEAGLDHVRIPARFSAHMLLEEPFTLDEEFLGRVDWALDQAASHGLAAIVDLHHFEELMKDPVGQKPRFLAIWRQLAERYKDRPASVKYELLNEPNGTIDAQWNALYPEAVAVVRAIDQNRALIIDGTSWAGGRSLGSLTFGDDPHLVATFHMYEPILFTHQGASWMPPEYQTSGLVFPGPPCATVTPAAGAQAVPWVKQWFQNYNQLPAPQNPGGPKTVEDIFAAVDSFVTQQKRAVYLGEFAAIDIADPDSRERWVRLVREHAEARGIPWAYWDDGGSNRAYSPSSGAWISYLERALFD